MTMSAIDEEILKGAEEDAQEVEFIKSYIGPDYCEQFSEEDIYYCLDVILEELDKLSTQADADGFIEIDVDAIVKVIEKKAKKEDMGPYDHDGLSLIVNAELDYNDQLSEE